MKKLILFLIVFYFSFNTGHAQYIYNAAANFNGTSSYVAVPNTPLLNPPTAITLEAWVYLESYSVMSTIITKNVLTSYYLGIESDGRVTFRPKAVSSLKSRVSSIIPLNKWTHIAGTADQWNARIFINGFLDSSRILSTGPFEINNDSLTIGASKNQESLLFFFHGRLDNVRIWSMFKNQQQILENMYIPLEIHRPTGIFSQLRASFQLDNDLLDFTGNTMLSGYPRQVTFTNYYNKAVNHLDYNNNLVLNGTTDYLSFDNVSGSGFNPSSAITLEAWIKRDTIGSQPLFQNILNKSGGSNRYDYSLCILNTGELKFTINSEAYALQSSALITNSQWTHVAASYNSSNSKAVLYINGDSVAGTFFGLGPAIHNNPDSLFIGGMGASFHTPYKFKGQIDAVRIWSAERTPNQVKENMYKVIYYALGLTNFNFDRYTNGIYSNGSTIFAGNNFVGSARISTARPYIPAGKLSSPILYEPVGFYASNYTSSYRRFYVPDANPAGVTDSIYVSSSGIVDNLKVFVLMSHPFIFDIKIELISPTGTIRLLFLQSFGRDLMTIFSDDADSVAGNQLNGSGITAPYSPGIKPFQALSSFNGQNMSGWWKLKVTDNSSFDIGYVHGWGLNLTEENKILKLTSYFQGLYNSTTNLMRVDTARVFLRNSTSPYSFIDTAKSILNSEGKGNFIFNNNSTDSNFYIVIEHRNSLETWSAAAHNFTADTLSYDFTFAPSQAFGSNQILVDPSPLKFGIHSGDVNRDDNIDLNDMINIYNDGRNFVFGYVVTDLTGDSWVDLQDLIITYNNSVNFVSVIRP